MNFKFLNHTMFLCTFISFPLDASTYIELGLYKDAVKCCDEGLAISFDILKSFLSIAFLWLESWECYM